MRNEETALDRYWRCTQRVWDDAAESYSAWMWGAPSESTTGGWTPSPSIGRGNLYRTLGALRWGLAVESRGAHRGSLPSRLTGAARDDLDPSEAVLGLSRGEL